MRSIHRAMVFGLFGPLVGMQGVSAQPVAEPEAATVFIEVSVEGPDPATGLRRTTKIGEGSGFLIHSKGWVVTAAHVIKAEVPATGKLIIMGSVRSRFATKFLLEMPPRASVASDATLLRFPPGLGLDFPFLCVVKHPNPVVGNPVTAAGFPLGFDISVRPGAITSLSGPDGSVQTNLGLAPGMSGGPVIDANHNVVGVIRGALDGADRFDYFTPVNLALPLFEAPPASFAGENCPRTTLVPASKTIERSYQIDETNDDHNGLSPSSRDYRIIQNSDPGYYIVDARLVRQSDTRVSDLNINVSADRQSVELKFKLSAGPVFDRWRGWLHGQLILTMAKKE